MKNKLLLLFIILFFCRLGWAQPNTEVTILYLLPFHLSEASLFYTTFKNSEEINQAKQFEMMGFWLGAKMALQQYEYTDKQVNVLVRDVVKDKYTLVQILQDSLLMKEVNIIVGPMYGALFPIAAEYAKNHNITIVNPFSTRLDFVKENPRVYKLIPPLYSRPEKIVEAFLEQPNNYNIILWGDSTQTPELLAYRYCFNERHINFRELHTLTLPLSTYKKNLIIAVFEEPTRVIHAVHTLINNETPADVTLVAPEQWFSITELNEDFYNLPELYFFTNYFVDEKEEAVKQFNYNYQLNYDAPAEIASFSYQGYDITRYFLELFFADFDSDFLPFSLLSYQFQWKKIENGGYENVKTRLIQVKNLELEEIK